MKTVFYVRVSKNEQRLENQLPELEAAAKARDLEITNIYQEKESAFLPNSRQYELERCLLDAEEHKFDVLLCYALDRLSRRGIPETLMLMERFRLLGVKVIAIKDAWTEFPSEMTPVIASITAWAANFESKRRRDRINSGLARARAEGIRLGRPPGKKDGKGVNRARSNYHRRWEREHEKQELNNHIEKLQS
jgi:DNA invertase Pin-like site-specific DNA recombinase